MFSLPICKVLNLLLGSFKQQRWGRQRKRYLKSEFALLQTSSRLFHIVQFVKCWQILVELNSKGLYRSYEKEKDRRCLVFKSSTKREIIQFRVVVLQRLQRNVQKSVMHGQSCCFANPNLLLFCRFRWRRRRHCSSFLLPTPRCDLRWKTCGNNCISLFGIQEELVLVSVKRDFLAARFSAGGPEAWYSNYYLQNSSAGSSFLVSLKTDSFIIVSLPNLYFQKTLLTRQTRNSGMLSTCSFLLLNE